MRHQLKCWLWKILWVVSALCLLAAWYSVIMRVPIGQFDALWLVWNALILGVLSIPIKLDCHDCGICSTKSM